MKKTIVCKRVTDGGFVALGSGTSTCEGCREPIFVARTSVEIAAESGVEATFLCVQCAIRSIPAGTTFQVPSRKQLEEVRNTLRGGPVPERESN